MSGLIFSSSLRPGLLAKTYTCELPPPPPPQAAGEGTPFPFSAWGKGPGDKKRSGISPESSTMEATLQETKKPPTSSVAFLNSSRAPPCRVPTGFEPAHAGGSLLRVPVLPPGGLSHSPPDGRPPMNLVLAQNASLASRAPQGTFLQYHIFP
jgi:hypothetical protein